MDKTKDIMVLSIIIVLILMIIYLVCDLFVHIPKITQTFKEKYILKVSKPQQNNSWEYSKKDDESEMFDFTIA